jgi:hypothetical protein
MAASIGLAESRCYAITRPLVTSVEPRGRMITDWVSAEQLRPVVSHRTASLYVKNAKQAEQEGRL